MRITLKLAKVQDLIIKNILPEKKRFLNIDQTPIILRIKL